MSGKSSGIMGILSEAAAHAEVRGLAEEVVRLGVAEYGNKKSAIGKISSEFGLGRWLRAVFHGERPTIHLHLYARLCGALEELNERQRERVNHNDEILKMLRNGNAAYSRGGGTLRNIGAEGGAAA